MGTLKFRLDFGRIFPGLILLFAGLVLLAVLLVVAVLAFFFSFMTGAGAVLSVALELLLIPALLIAAGVVTALTGVAWWGQGGEGWFSGMARRRARLDRMRASARGGEVVGAIITIVVFLFLYENQLRGVAFFASDFGSLAQFFFYAPLFTGMALSLARAVYGRRNGLRPFDSVNALFLAAAAFWLLSVFPFDFSHFGDMFPSSIGFVFWWLTNDVGRFLLTLAGLCALVNSVYTAFLYSAVRGELHRMRSSPV